MVLKGRIKKKSRHKQTQSKRNVAFDITYGITGLWLVLVTMLLINLMKNGQKQPKNEYNEYVKSTMFPSDFNSSQSWFNQSNAV